jgi:uncharacterized membrane protein YccC
LRFWQTILRFQVEKVDPWLAARNTLGVAIPLIAGVALHQIPAALAVSIGALNVSYSDSHAPYVQRARRLLAASLLCAGAVFIGASCAGKVLIAVAAIGAWAFAAGLLVALSTNAADVGLISLVTLIVFEARPLPLEQAAIAGALALGGGLIESALALAFWPIYRYVPEQRALSDLYLELSRAAEAPVQFFAAPPASAQSTQAQNALASLAGDHSLEGDRYRVLLSQAERARLSLFALRRLHVRIARANPQSSPRALLERYLVVAGRILRDIGSALMKGTPANLAAPLHELDTLAEKMRAEPAVDVRLQMDALTGQLRAAAELAAHAVPAGLNAFARQEVRKPWRLQAQGTLATLRANLSLDSAAFRHAARLAVCVALSQALAQGLELGRPYWMPMTVAVVLKPDFASTFSRGVLRLAGTFLGLVLATGLFHLLPPAPAAQVAVIVALTFVMRCWGPANYGILATSVTGLIVVLIAMTGVAPKGVIMARGLNTALGGAMALLAYWLWPTWERSHVPEELAQMLDAYRAYFRTIREGYIQHAADFEAALDRTRIAARLARSNLEASLDRLSAEPGTTTKTARALAGMLASSHRLVHSLMALEAGLSTSTAVPAREAFRRFANDTDLTLYLLAAALRGSKLARADLPDLREDHHALVHSGDPPTERYALVNVETDRVTNSLNTLREQVLGWLASSPG